MARWRGALAVLVLVAGSLVLARVAGLERATLTRPEIWLRDFVTAINVRLAQVREGLAPLGGAILRYRSLLAENEALRAEIGRLTAENNRLQEYRLENVRLKRLLGLKEDLPQYDLLPARVVGRHPDSWFATVTIDRGARDGVAKDMAVVDYQGLVGRVVAVSEKSAEVMLLIDREAAVGALIQPLRLPGVIRGTGDPSGRLLLVHLPFDAPVRANQVVVTSGLGGTFPPGLRIGYVVSAEPEASGLMQRAVVQAFVDFGRLEEVMVIRNFGGS